MRNLLIITQKVDEQDDLLGFFVDWIRGFATKFDKVFVITLAKGSYDLPENVFIYSLGKERGNSKIIRVSNFYRYLFKLVPQSNGIFAHMSPVFVIASWPVSFVFRKKIILWYLHRSVTFRLKLAEKLCYKIVTATKESLKFHSNKIVETGHGISVEKFRTEKKWNSGRLNILSVGRISKIKNFETLIESAKILKEKGIDFEIKIIGKPVMPRDDEYLKHLELLIKSYELGEMINFVGFIPHNKIVPHYKEADMVVGLTPDGGIDKTILEGMASGCVVLTSNSANKKYFGHYSEKLIFNYGDSDDLADKMMIMNNLTSEEKNKIGRLLVESVSQYHNLENLIEKISILI